MFRHLPSLAALRTFEAAARHESFKLAALELCVTPAAVGGQIKTLETQLDCELFTRSHRRSRLTPAGRTLQATCNSAFSILADGISTIQNRATGPVLSIGAGSLFASSWLMQKLPRFWEAHPALGLRVHHAPKHVDLEKHGLDAMIAWGDGPWKGVDTDVILPVTLTPVAKPNLVEKFGWPTSPEDVLRFPLLYEYDEHDWRDWFAAQGIARPALRPGTIIDDGVVAYRAALDGQGVLLGVGSFVQADIETGRLVRLFDTDVPTKRAYYLITPPQARGDANISAFRHWLIKESRARDLTNPGSAIPHLG